MQVIILQLIEQVMFLHIAYIKIFRKSKAKGGYFWRLDSRKHLR